MAAFGKVRRVCCSGQKVLDIGGSRQIGEAKVTENFGASLDNLDSRDRLLARRDKPQTKCIRLEKGCEKGGQQDGGDEDFNERCARGATFR